MMSKRTRSVFSILKLMRAGKKLGISRAVYVSAAAEREVKPSPEDGPDAWHSLGDDPIFHLHATRFPTRWVLLDIELSTIEGRLAPSLYVDSGSGFTEGTRIFLPQPNRGRVRALCRLPDVVVALRFDPMEVRGRFVMGRIKFIAITPVQALLRAIPRMIAQQVDNPRESRVFLHQLFNSARGGDLKKVKLILSESISPIPKKDDYQLWVALHGNLSGVEKDKIIENMSEFSYRPTFSIIMPTYNSPPRWLNKAIESVQAQLYPNWELCIADDRSTSPNTLAILRAAARDDRIKVIFREENGHISLATNTAIESATGNYFVFMDHDDEITPDALYRFAEILDADKTVDFIYSDEDKIDTRGIRYDPFFKPDWSPEYLESCMYTAHLACYRRDIVERVGLLRSAFNGAQDYDFTLRYTEHVNNVAHVPKILYHWRAIDGSTAQSMENKDYVIDAGTKALQERLDRTGRGGVATPNYYKGCWDTIRDVEGKPLVSIVIPSAGRDGLVRGKTVDLLVNCLTSLREITAYRNYEIIVVDNGDMRESTLKALEDVPIRFLTYPNGQDFNIAIKMNMGAEVSNGEFILFLNDDIEVVTPYWLGAMVAIAQNPGMGVVGAKLHFEDGSLQHVGVTFCEGLPDHVRRLYSEADPGYNFSSVAQRNYMAVTGACMLIGRELFNEVGGFDERLAINYNDIDLCLKVYSKGKRVTYSPNAQLFHYESLSRERTVAPHEQDLFLKKWGDLTKVDPYYSHWFDGRPPNFELAPL